MGRTVDTGISRTAYEAWESSKGAKLWNAVNANIIKKIMQIIYKNYKIRENCELVQDDGFLTPEGKYYFDVWNVGKKEMEDIINHPNHYTNKAHECIDEMVAVFGVPAVIDYCKCCVWKYRYRADSKGHHDEDMKKADWYMSKIMELMETRSKSGAW